MTRLTELLALGQSPWLDYIRRSLLTSGELRRMVVEDGITGVTINPTIFEKAIAGSHDYDEALRTLLTHEPHLSPAELYERLAVEDVQMAADVLRPVFDRTKGRDGFVSLEVAPGLAHDTVGTIAEARRLWEEVGRPNLLIKVPGTAEGVPAVEALLAAGINVNVTLLFSLSHYEAVAQAYLRALARTPDPGNLASVASVFVSRIDSAVDHALDASPVPGAAALKGTVAIANARVIYARYRELFETPSFTGSAGRGAGPQRVLWASTSTKDPAYRDTMYVEELVGPQTVDTIPPATLTAFEDHGVLHGATLAEGVDAARNVLAGLSKFGISLEKVTTDLQSEGVAAFLASYATLLGAIAAKKSAVLAAAVDPQSWNLAGAESAVGARLALWQGARVPDRIWKADPTVWPAATPQDVATRLGWLSLPERMHDQLPKLAEFVAGVRADGIRHVVVLGMGGSSLAPDVFRRTFGHREGYPELLVLDSTHPRAIAALERLLDPKATLFLVSSKSGTTTEPLSFYRYFWEFVRASGTPPGSRFVAVTDPGTPLEQLARDQGFRAVFPALATVGGRYSALTTFGLVPAALAGVDLRSLLDQAWTMAEACAPTVPASQSPGLSLGAALGEVAVRGRDKLTFCASAGFAAFPVWVEQLVAESTGKVGRGIVPIVDEPNLDPSTYGTDRFFVELQEKARPDENLAAHTRALEAAGHPVVRIQADDLLDLGQEFFRWEFAVATAGAIVGIDPFDQPDVEFAKELARQAMAKPAGSAGPAAPPTVRGDDLPGLRSAVRAWTGLARPGDYVAIQAYLPPAEATWGQLQELRRRMLVRLHVATTLGYGPRFLHSTGQLHKGGPNTGLFLQIVDDPSPDLAVPGAGFTFGQLIRAQSLGDYQAMQQKGRRILRVDLGADRDGGLQRLAEAVDG